MKKTRKRENSFDNFINKEEFSKGHPVFLNVYHLSWINYILQILGFGLYHTTIEVFNTEYSFGATTDDVPGIFANKAETNTKLKVKGKPPSYNQLEKIYLGHTLFSQETIYQLLSIQSSFWIGKSYDPFLKNCNHFTKFLANKLLMNCVSYPLYINRLSKYGMLFASFYPPIKTLYGDIANNVQPKTNQVFERNSFHAIRSDSDHHQAGEESQRRKHKELTFKDIILKIENQANSEQCNNDNETHQMIRECRPQMLQEKCEENICKTLMNKTKHNDFFFEVLLMNKFLHFFEYNMDIIDADQIDESDSNYKIVVDFIELVISADHSLHIQQNYTKSIDLFKQLSSMIAPSSQGANSLIDIINKYPASALIKSLVFPSSYTTSQIFAIKMHHSLHFIYFTQGDYIKQEEELNQILSLDPNDYYAIFGLASVRYSQCKFPEVETLLNEVQHSCKDKDCLFHIEKFSKLLTDML